MDCVTDDGIISGDPEELPKWAQGHWTISKQAVNFMLSPLSESPDLLEVPKNVLPGAMIAEMKSALGAGQHRSSLMRKWFANAEKHISENSPIAHDSHGASGHR